MQIRTDMISTSLTICHLIFGGDKARTKWGKEDRIFRELN